MTSIPDSRNIRKGRLPRGEAALQSHTTKRHTFRRSMAASSLPGPRGWSTSTPSSRQRSVRRVVNSPFSRRNRVWVCLRKREILHRDQRISSSIAPWPSSLDLFLVRGEVEADKQEQIAREYAHAGERGEFLTGALAHGREVGEIRGGEVGVAREVDEAEVDDELDDLQHGDVLLPPDADAARGLEVVPVHDDVDEEVEGDGDPGDGGVAEELGEAEEGGGAVVVGVQEGEGFLFQDEEDGVEEFEEFGQVVELQEMVVSIVVRIVWGAQRTYVVQCD